MAPPPLDPPWISLRTRSNKPGNMPSSPPVKNGADGDASSPGPPLAIVCMECNSTSSPVWHQKNGGQHLCNGCVYGSKGGNTPALSPLVPSSTLKEGGPCVRCGAKRASRWTSETGGAILCSSCSSTDSCSPKKCAECHVTETPRWRKAPNGSILCNACGVRYRRKNPKNGPRRGRGRTVRIRSKCYNCDVPSTRWPDTLCIDCGEKWTKHGTPKDAKTCSHCNMADTGRWLRGPDGPKSLCNACGKRWAKWGTLKYTRKPSDYVPRAIDDVDEDPAEGEDSGGHNSGVRNPANSGAGSSSSRRPQCSECNTMETTKWRTGPQGRRTLCDECGIRWKYSGSRVVASKTPPRSPRTPSMATPMTTRSRRASAEAVHEPAPVRNLDYSTTASPSPEVKQATVAKMVTTTTMVDDARSPPPEEHYASSLLAILGKRGRMDSFPEEEEGDRASPCTEESDKKKLRTSGGEGEEWRWNGGGREDRKECLDIISRLEKATALIEKKVGDEEMELDRSELDTLNGLVRIGLGKLKDKLLN